MGWVALIAKGATDTMGMIQSLETSKMEQKELETQAQYQRQLAEEERERGERGSDATEKDAIERARRVRSNDRKIMEKNRAMMAGSGVSLTEGSPLKIEEENDITSRLNVNEIFDDGLNKAGEMRYQSKLTQRGLLNQASEFEYGATMQKYQRKQVVRNFFIGMGAQAVKGYASKQSQPQAQSYSEYSKSVNSRYESSFNSEPRSGGFTESQSQGSGVGSQSYSNYA